MKKSIAVLWIVLMTLVLLPAWSDAFAEGTNEWVEVTAGNSPFLYSDSLLMVDEHRLDPDIAKISAALSAAAYNSSTTQSMLTQMGFTTIESHYDASYSLNNCDHVGYTIAKKTCGEYTIYCVPIRGTPTSKGSELLEWVSNFNLSVENGYHMGFGRAANEVMADLMAMINADGSSSDKRIIWFTGHSRGAAVSNILAGKCTSAGMGHVFAYTFACPYVYSGNAPAYTNIYNFNFVNDFVPQIPLASWGFSRYGIDGTKDIASWAESIMTKTEVDTIINTLDSILVPDSASTKLFFSLLSWGLIDGDNDDLRIMLDDITDDPDAFIYLVTNKYGIDETIVTLKTEYISMLTFWDNNYRAMSELPNEDWATFRSLEANAKIFALYDKVAGSTVSSFEQLLNLIPVIEARNAAANDISSMSDILSVFFDTNWKVKDLFKAHSSTYYLKWMNQKYWGYQGCKGNNYENAEITINARTISPNCFENATGSFTVNMENVEAIGKYAFSNCSGLTGAEWGSGVRFVGSHAFQNCANMRGTVRLGEGMTSLPEAVFRGCSGLEEIIIPDSVKMIEEYAFSGCGGLKKVTLPLSSEYQSYDSTITRSFMGCTNVEELVFTKGDGTVFQDAYNDWRRSLPEESQNALKKVTFAEGVTAMPKNVLYGCSAVTEVILPSTLTEISVNAFRYCSLLASIEIPKKVTSVGAHAFAGCYELTGTVDLSSGKSIGEYAFYDCIGLTSIELGKTLQSIGTYAFYNCSSLVTMTIPQSVTVIPAYAFSGCAAWEGSFPIWETTESIGLNAFANCSSLTGTVKIPDSFTAVEKNVFFNCSGLEELIIPDSVKSIGDEAFYYNTGLKKVTMPLSCEFPVAYSGQAFSGCTNVEELVFTAGDGTVFEEGYDNSGYKGGLPEFSRNKLKKVTFAEGVTVLPEDVLYDCSAVTEVVLPSTLTEISAYAFWRCYALASIEIPENVRIIGNSAFSSCTGLAGTVSLGAVESIGESAFYGCNGLTSIELGETLQSIGTYAFYNCSSLVTMTIPQSVTVIPAYAFSGCGAWEGSFPIWETTESIGLNAFANCSSLTGTVKIPDSFTAVEKNVFFNCSGLEELIIPDSVKSIGSEAFYYNTGLKKVTMPLSCEFPVAYSGQAFSGCTNVEELVFTAGDGTVFEAGYDKSGYKCSLPAFSRNKLKKVTFAEGVTAMPKDVLYDCNAVTEVVLPSTLTGISAYAFYNCRALESIDIPENVTSIGNCAFYGCSGMVSVEKGTALQSIGESAFYGCSSLVSVELGETLQSIGMYAFYNCSSLVTMTIPQSVTVIPAYAFSGCGAWEGSFPIWETTESIGLNAFTNCFSLTGTVKIPDSFTAVEKNVFFNCSGLEELIIPDSVKSIGSEAFYYNTGLKKVTMPLSCEFPVAYSGQAFSGCTNVEELVFTAGDGTVFEAGYDSSDYKAGLPEFSRNKLKKVTFAEGVTVLPKDVLYECNAVTEVVLPSTLTGISAYAFYNCRALESIELRENVTSIGNCAFYGCTGLRAITFKGSALPTMGNSAWVNVPAAECTVYCYNGSGIEVWAAANGFKVFYSCLTHTEVILAAVAPSCTEDGLTEGKHCSVCGETLVAQEPVPAKGHTLVVTESWFEVTEGDVLTLGDFAEGCVHMVDFVLTAIPSDTAMIVVDNALQAADAGHHTIQLNIMLSDGFSKEVTIAALIHAQKAMNLPAALTEIGEEAFMGSAAEEFILQDGVTTIGPRAFSDSSMKLITIPDNVTSIAADAFDGCNVTIITPAGSVAEVFAQEHGIPYVNQ